MVVCVPITICGKWPYGVLPIIPWTLDYATAVFAKEAA
jgi:hypothetical protein